MRARKRFGQHFLERPGAGRLGAAMDRRPGETFLEIGRGRGALTDAVVGGGATVPAVEIDRDLAAGLAGSPHPRLHVHTGDFRAMPDET